MKESEKIQIYTVVRGGDNKLKLRCSTAIEYDDCIRAVEGRNIVFCRRSYGNESVGVLQKSPDIQFFGRSKKEAIANFRRACHIDLKYKRQELKRIEATYSDILTEVDVLEFNVAFPSKAGEKKWLKKT